MIIAVFPGQGLRPPGFPLAVARDRRDAVSVRPKPPSTPASTSSPPATEWMPTGSATTSVAQPLIVAASLLSWNVLRDRAPKSVEGVAGHSVGEFAALAASGVLSEADALRLVGIRCRAMAEAAATVQTGMSAVVGGDEQTVLDRLDAPRSHARNYNGGGQIVAGRVSSCPRRTGGRGAPAARA